MRLPFSTRVRIEEQAISPIAGESDPRYELTRLAARVDKQLYPLAFAAGAEMFGQQEARFEEAAELIVVGMAAQLGRGNPSV